MSEKDNSEFDLQYQKGVTDVQHRNVDAAGENHPFGDTPESFEADLSHLIRKVADDLYESWEATIREYLANAETACLKVEQFVNNPENSMYDTMMVDDSYQPKIQIIWNKQEDKLTIQDNGIGMAAREVDEIFRQIGHSASRDDGSKSGMFGMGALSFSKMVGLDNAAIMTTHSRLNGDNAGYYLTLSGVEPIMGSLPDDQYGTKFQMTPKEDFAIRQAIETYAEWMRVPVRYEEIGTDGMVEFQEDYGDKALYEAYKDKRICLGARMSGAFEAYSSPDADNQTLLLSMDIERNDGKYEAGQHGAPFPFDIRLLDESGKVIESSNGNEGLMPAPRPEYMSMLKEARDPYITEDLLNNGDVLAQELADSRGLVVSDEVMADIESGNIHVPPNEYVTKDELTDSAEPGATRVISGPHKGKMLISKEEWKELDEGRASLYVPEDELEPYDIETGEGDLQMPQPTSDRDRLQSHETFWKYVGKQFGGQFDGKVNEVYESLDGDFDTLETIMQFDPEEMVVNPEGFGES